MQGRQKQAGFAVIEAVLIIIIIGIVAGVGYWVLKQRQSNKSTATTNNPQTQTTAIKPGTTAAIDSVLAGEQNDEAKADNKAVNSVNTSVTQTQTSAAAIGDSYNEANF